MSIKAITFRAIGPAFLPAWKLFEDLGEVFILYHRVGQSVGHSENQMSEWQLTLPKHKRSLWSSFWGLFWNPQVNLSLACGSLLQHFQSDLYECDWGMGGPKPQDLESLTSYRLIRNLVESVLSLDAKVFYQFKICSVDLNLNTPEEEVILSPIYRSGS